MVVNNRRFGTLLIPLFILFFFSTGYAATDATPTTPIMVETPDRCSTIDHIDGGNLYLKKPDTCVQPGSGVTKIFLPITNTPREIRIFVNGKFWKTHTIPEFNVTHIQNLFEEKRKVSSELDPENIGGESKKKAEEVAQRISAKVNSDAYQTKVALENERLRQEVFHKQIEEYSPKTSDKEDEKQHGSLLNQDERVYLFISSSIPKPVLRSYIQDLDRVGDPNVYMVLKGFIGGGKTIKPTFDFFQDLLGKDPQCNPMDHPGKGCDAYRVNIIIDPLLFRRYGIKEVPTMVYARGINRLMGHREGTEGDSEKVKIGDTWSITGDSSVSYMLERINREAKSPFVDRYLTAMRRGFYQ